MKFVFSIAEATHSQGASLRLQKPDQAHPSMTWHNIAASVAALFEIGGGCGTTFREDLQGHGTNRRETEGLRLLSPSAGSFLSAKVMAGHPNFQSEWT